MADSEYKSNNSQKGLDNRIYFVNTGGYRIGSDWIDNQKQTKGFKVGQKVKVVVNFGLGVIQWKVNESVRLKLKCDSLKDNSIKWVPYLWFNSSGDCIEICDY